LKPIPLLADRISAINPNLIDSGKLFLS
jgi:hypothetical protein